ncbi:MAG TPA: TraR/DksA C4-type zinc finger protein [Actinomycetales bacterium]|nr:TraR/DksA C4-type zinc finger protein [Actinomycetales bacterium]
MADGDSRAAEMDLDGVRAALRAKAADVRAQMEELSAPTAEVGGISFGKRVGDGTSLAVERLSQVAAHERLQQVLEDVRRAEEKLDDGTYGTCDGCGRPIAPARLEALPWAVECVECAGKRARRR